MPVPRGELMYRPILLGPLLLAFSVPAAAADLITGVATVIDGDTIEVHGKRIRLHGIDAPESAQVCLDHGAKVPCGRKSAFALADHLGRQVVVCEQKDRDRYGRVVAVCHVGGIDVNHWMVARGWALAYRRYSRDYVDAENVAQTTKSGIWQWTFDPPWEWRKSRRAAGRDATTEKDCGDFRSHAEAQAFFEAAGPGDPHRLDRDGNGQACEGLP